MGGKGMRVQSLTGLETLWLIGTGVTSEGLIQLRGLTQLRDLFLQNSQVSDAGFNELQKALPNLRIHR
jgi:hypothetical protein